MCIFPTRQNNTYLHYLSCLQKFSLPLFLVWICLLINKYLHLSSFVCPSIVKSSKCAFSKEQWKLHYSRQDHLCSFSSSFALWNISVMWKSFIKPILNKKQNALFLNVKHLADTTRNVNLCTQLYQQYCKHTHTGTFIFMHNIQNSRPAVTDKGSFLAERMTGICFVFSRK